jgi:penicillin-binding protein 1C
VSLEYARWPTLLEPWIDPQWKSETERLPLTPPCRATTPDRALRLMGIESGSVIRPAPGQQAAVVRVQAVGAREGVNWLLDGRLIGSGRPDQSLRMQLDQPGDHALTAIDQQGRYERVAFTVKPAAVAQ